MSFTSRIKEWIRTWLGLQEHMKYCNKKHDDSFKSLIDIDRWLHDMQNQVKTMFSTQIEHHQRITLLENANTEGFKLPIKVRIEQLQSGLNILTQYINEINDEVNKR